ICSFGSSELETVTAVAFVCARAGGMAVLGKLTTAPGPGNAGTPGLGLGGATVLKLRVGSVRGLGAITAAGLSEGGFVRGLVTVVVGPGIAGFTAGTEGCVAMGPVT